MKWATLAVTLKRTDRLLHHVVAWPSAGPISPEVRLAIALRFLAGGQILDLRMCYHVVKSECYRPVRCVVDGVDRCAALQAESPMRDTAKLRVLEAEFHAKSVGGVWTGQALAVDGAHFEQLNPGSAVGNLLRYYATRRSCYALLCIAGCGAECRFLVLNISQRRKISKYHAKSNRGRDTGTPVKTQAEFMPILYRGQ